MRRVFWSFSKPTLQPACPRLPYWRLKWYGLAGSLPVRDPCTPPARDTWPALAGCTGCIARMLITSPRRKHDPFAELVSIFPCLLGFPKSSYRARVSKAEWSWIRPEFCIFLAVIPLSTCMWVSASPSVAWGWYPLSHSIWEDPERWCKESIMLLSMYSQRLITFMNTLKVELTERRLGSNGRWFWGSSLASPLLDGNG